jgi:hypothetical protein
MSLCRGLYGLLVILFAQSAGAQQPDNKSQVTRFLQSKFNRDAVNNNIRLYGKALPGRCTDLEIGTKFTVFFITPIQFSPDGRRLVAGVWQERVPVRACGVERLYNVLTSLRNDGALVRSNLLLGSTRADPRLQLDSVAYARASATLRAPPGCKSFDILDTAFLGQGAAAQAKGPGGREMRPWRERWTTQTCGVRTTVLMTFTPHAKGTTIAATVDPKAK